MFGTDQTLLIRALNSTRQGYFPSYVGLRLIGSQLPRTEHSYLRRLILRRLSAGDQWRFRPYRLYKGERQSAHGPVAEYRECLAPSPLTAVAEAVVLAQLSAVPAFSVPSRAFSYLWPRSPQAGASYEFFAEGYKRRNAEIGALLLSPNRVAVIMDLKGFYPSVDKGRIESSLKSLLAASDTEAPFDTDAILNFYSQVLSAGAGGIPIGPASCHVLGHVVLKDVDTELTEAYGGNYFRYVDDIIVVCDRADASRAMSRVQECVRAQGFQVNTDKTLVLDGQEWRHNILRPDVDDEDDFRRFTHDLAVYLAFHPGRGASVGQMLADGGLSMPMRRVNALSTYSRFRYFIGRRHAQGGLPHAAGMVLARDRQFLDRGLRLKRTYENSLARLVQERREDSPNLRRWQVQRVRRVANSLFYLRKFSEWSESSYLFDSFPELVEQRALSSALSSGTVNPILAFYGRGPAAFAELWAEHGDRDARLAPLPSAITPAELDSLITLRLHGVIGAEPLQSYGEDGGARLLRVVNQTMPVARTSPDLSFEDEFESLRLGTSDHEVSDLARTRYSRSEGTTLEALSLSSAEYRS